MEADGRAKRRLGAWYLRQGPGAWRDRASLLVVVLGASQLELLRPVELGCIIDVLCTRRRRYGRR